VNDTEQLIKEALNRQADRAPHPGPTLSALRRPARKRSRSSIFLTIGVAAAAAAVVFTAGVLVGKGPSPNDGAAALMPTTAADAGQLKFGPKWLPDGFVEVSRTVSKEGFSRTWTKDGQGLENAEWEPVPYVTVGSRTHLPVGYEQWEDVPVRKGRGHVHVGELPKLGSLATVIVTESDFVTRSEPLVVTVRSVPNARDLALQIANSVEPDASAGVLSAVELNGVSQPDVEGRSPTEWTSEITVGGFVVKVSTEQPDLKGGVPVNVRGKEGTFVPGYLPQVVVQEGRLWLAVRGSDASQDQLIAAANAAKINQTPGYEWLGSRP
jgi:hypothetical protein